MLNQVGSFIFVAKSGRTFWRYIGVDLLARFMKGYSSTESARLLEEALYDPEVARDLATVFAGKRLPALVAKRLNTWLLAVGGGQDDRLEVPTQ